MDHRTTFRWWETNCFFCFFNVVFFSYEPRQEVITQEPPAMYRPLVSSRTACTLHTSGEVLRSEIHGTRELLEDRFEPLTDGLRTERFNH